MYDSSLCDIEIFQEIVLPRPGGGSKNGMHRSCPPSIQPGYAWVNSPGIPLYPFMVPVGLYDIRAEAMTQDKRRIFCVEGTFNITN
jgi:hypothetical protein